MTVDSLAEDHSTVTRTIEIVDLADHDKCAPQVELAR
jgi:hypothetical protein